MIEIRIKDASLVFTNGVNLRYLAPGNKLPHTYQLPIGFENESYLVFFVRMYGGSYYCPECQPL
ncbi:MAG: hypothetical protein LUE93_16125 [Bacteroides sp.]|nr:hypothetical protein [Bacteroides sp.]